MSLAVFSGCALLAVFPVVFRQVHVSDFFWHEAIGRWLVSRLSQPDFSTWYFTPVQDVGGELRWTWLGDVGLFLIHAGGGMFAVQMLPVICLVLAWGFLLKGSGAGRGPLTAAVLFAVALGTYQLQLHRNSVFSLALLPLLCFLDRQFALLDFRRHLMFFSVIFFWSHLHGSCLLGWAAGAALYLGRALEGSQEAVWLRVRRLAVSAVVLAVLFLALSFGRPGA